MSLSCPQNFSILSQNRESKTKKIKLSHEILMFGHFIFEYFWCCLSGNFQIPPPILAVWGWMLWVLRIFWPKMVGIGFLGEKRNSWSGQGWGRKNPWIALFRSLVLMLIFLQCWPIYMYEMCMLSYLKVDHNCSNCSCFSTCRIFKANLRELDAQFHAPVFPPD